MTTTTTTTPAEAASREMVDHGTPPLPLLGSAAATDKDHHPFHHHPLHQQQQQPHWALEAPLDGCSSERVQSPPPPQFPSLTKTTDNDHVRHHLVVPANHQQAATRSTNYSPDTAHIVQSPGATRTIVNDTIGTTHLVQHPHQQQQQQQEPPLQLQLVQILPHGQHVYMRVGDVPAVLPPPPWQQLQTLYIPPHDHMVPNHVGNSSSSRNKSAFSSLPSHSPRSVSNGNGQFHAHRASVSPPPPPPQMYPLRSPASSSGANFDRGGTDSPASDHSYPSSTTAASRSLREKGRSGKQRRSSTRGRNGGNNSHKSPRDAIWD
jgi:hypothetical protein